MARDLFADPDVLPGRAIDQPYAGLIRLGLKTLETRLFRVHKRGPFVVCATRREKTDFAALRRIRAQLVPQRIAAEVFDAAVELHGCSLALATITGCRLLTKADEPISFFWRDDDAGKRWAWEMSGIHSLRPHPVSCMPGFFPVDRRIVVVEGGA